jgi:hypothetical protein
MPCQRATILAVVRRRAVWLRLSRCVLKARNMLGGAPDTGTHPGVTMRGEPARSSSFSNSSLNPILSGASVSQR